jgi:hypothetical protein
MRDRRFELRQAANEQVELSWPGDAGVDQACTGILHNVSVSGSAIWLERPIPTNTKVRASIRGATVNASVRSCARSKSGFMVGIEFDPEFQGSVRTKA